MAEVAQAALAVEDAVAALAAALVPAALVAQAVFITVPRITDRISAFGGLALASVGGITVAVVALAV